ncbi:MAG: DUF932 domain-containing protein [Polyangiaceae bacterium]|nr:DUF932 domain-containing protein [Polyangiaceae bacterium]
MAHEVETMMFVGESPWHRLGVKLDAPPTTREAMVAAGLDWVVGTKPLYTAHDDGSHLGELVNHKATYRVSDGKVLGVVGPGYSPLQNADAFSWFDPFVEAGEATIETAGSLRGGQRVWVLAKLNRKPCEIVRGDEVLKYLLLANAHDGTLATRVGFTPIRVVCANTLAMSIDCGESKLLRVRHTKGIKSALDAIRDTMNAADAAFEATAEQYRTLARKQINGEDLRKYIQLVFPRAKVAEEPTFETSSDFDKLLNRPIMDRETPKALLGEKTDRESRYVGTITELFENGRGNDLPGVRGTLWAAYNAVTEFTTHHRGRTDEARMQAQFNDGMRINGRALSAALEMAAA